MGLFKDEGETLVSAHSESDFCLKYSVFSDKAEVLLLEHPSRETVKLKHYFTVLEYLQKGGTRLTWLLNFATVIEWKMEMCSAAAKQRL